jgi:hypothetical protein
MKPPLFLAVVERKTGELTKAALHVDPVAIDQRRASRACFEFIGVLLGEGLRPHFPTGRRIQAVGGFLTAGIIEED